jgi:hypothetical protein
MNKLILLISIVVVMSFNSDDHQLQTENSSQEKIIETSEPYDVKFQVKKLKSKTYNLIIDMELEKDAHYVSPNSKGNYSGIFTMILEDNKKIHVNGKFSESPQSKESVDPWSGNPVNFVQEDTTHKQQFTIANTNDFEVSGYIQFTIEPRCTLEKVHFKIMQKSGVLEIQKLTTKR